MASAERIESKLVAIRRVIAAAACAHHPRWGKHLAVVARRNELKRKRQSSAPTIDRHRKV